MTSEAPAHTLAAEAADLRADAMSAILASNWWAVALRGLAGVVFGLIALFATGAAILSAVIVFAAWSIVDGIFNTVAAIRAARGHERWMLLALNGVLSIAIGVIAAAWPGITVLAFVILIAAGALISGVLAIASAVRLKKSHGRWWMAIGGVLSIAFAVLLVLAPMLGAIVLTWWIGAYALVFGVTLMVLAFRLRARRSDVHAPGAAQPA